MHAPLLPFCQRDKEKQTNGCLSARLQGQSRSEEAGAARASADLRGLPRGRARPSQATVATSLALSPPLLTRPKETGQTLWKRREEKQKTNEPG